MAQDHLTIPKDEKKKLTATIKRIILVMKSPSTSRTNELKTIYISSALKKRGGLAL